MQKQILTVFSLLLAIVFLPTTIVLFIGMLPTIVVSLLDKSRKKTKAITVGAVNLAGCVPFMLEMWSNGQSIETAIALVMNPITVIAMYVAAAAGHAIDWVMSGFVAGVLYQRGISRQKAIIERQEELIKRWGEEVTGRIPLDERGFRIIPSTGKAPEI